MTRGQPKASNRRKYIRLDSVFPVEFRCLSQDNKLFLSDWLQGFTDNIGEGGICLFINNPNSECQKIIEQGNAKFSLVINLPVGSKPISAVATLSWVRQPKGSAGKYCLGLSYESIDAKDNRRIMRYARLKRMFVPAIFSVILALGLVLGIQSYWNWKLIKGNKVLVEQLVNIIQESAIAKQKVKEFARNREELQIKIQALESRIQTVGKEKDSMQKETQIVKLAYIGKLDSLGKLITRLGQEKSALQEQLISVQQKETNVTEELLRLDKKKANLTRVNLEKMTQWLKIHQNPHTGLVISFEGDEQVANWAFTYDQSLTAQIFTNLADYELAQKVFDFYAHKAVRKNDLFYNAYYANDGSPAEYTLQSGPNIWLGIAILQYTKRSQDNKFLYLAEEIAKAIVELKHEDKEGGLRGGPDVSWYSTEHNLDAYAFFNMLYKITAKPAYLHEAETTLDWLVQHTYDRRDVPVKRGKGDSTIATDTYAWSVAAIGPEKLEKLGMVPERIMEFAEKNCSVETIYKRPEGEPVKIKGFDFSPQSHVARGGVVSSEWTAQMVISYKIMADFYYKKELKAKAHAYEMKADEYLAGLANMIISSPSPSGQGESCLPYATQEVIDTGHGWVTPAGASTGSVAGTAYTIFAYYNYNPLELRD